MARVDGLTQLRRRLEKLERASSRQNNGTINVGYAASYAVYVHENMKAAHGTAFNAKHGKAARGPKQQAKFLEQPARQLQGEMATTIELAVKAGNTLLQVLIKAGQRLQAASQKLVPVDTGNLKGSAFTERE